MNHWWNNILYCLQIGTPKYNTQNVKVKSITEKTLIVGIDVGSETHFVRAWME